MFELQFFLAEPVVDELSAPIQGLLENPRQSDVRIRHRSQYEGGNMAIPDGRARRELGRQGDLAGQQRTNDLMQLPLGKIQWPLLEAIRKLFTRPARESFNDVVDFV